MLFGVELRRLKTDYQLPVATTASSTHLSLGLGVQF
jgi:hypothetical protein